MPILSVTYKRSVTQNNNNMMSLEQFRQWLKRIDTNGDGRISKQELEEALRKLGIRFARWRAKRAIAHSDKNHNGLVDGDLEIIELLEYVKKRWGIVIP
ncbi:EF-hand domain [Macleaya cordata]|uniref:EF-hand domain n=1 Tax=Macleaya cordata TaxID=56857 RepID=A0A200QZB8_MACCD|nr:EF-hand domain [Macleaya cordata]